MSGARDLSCRMPDGRPDQRAAASRERPHRSADGPTPAPAEPSGTSGLTVDIDRGRPRPVVVLRGRLDATGGALFAAVVDHVAATLGAPVLVDLSRVPVVDAHGLLPALRREVVVVDASPKVRRLLAALGTPAPLSSPVPEQRRIDGRV